jgi:hypothetical protein
MSAKSVSKSVHGALYLELQEKGITGRTKPNVYCTVSIELGNLFMLLSSNGYTVGVREEDLENIKQILNKHYRIFKIEFTPGSGKALKSADFDEEFAIDLAATLKPNQLEVFLDGETRVELLALRLANVSI